MLGDPESLGLMRFGILAVRLGRLIARLRSYPYGPQECPLAYTVPRHDIVQIGCIHCEKAKLVSQLIAEIC